MFGMYKWMEFYTDLSQEECIEVIRSRSEPQKFISELLPNPDVPMFHKIEGLCFRLWANCHGLNNSKIQPLFYGRFLTAEKGTRIRGRFKLHPSVEISWFFSIPMVPFFALLMLAVGFYLILIEEIDAGWLIVISLLLFCALMARTLFKARAFTRPQRERIIEFLELELKAKRRDTH